MRGAYTGHEALTFSQYIDVETGKTLHAEPGGVYEIMPASGYEVPEIPVPWFTWADDPEKDAADETGGEIGTERHSEEG